MLPFDTRGSERLKMSILFFGASTDHSVELRTPLVDAHLLVSLQGALPSFDRYPNKRLLAEAPQEPRPRDIIVRRKTGFGVPVGRWLVESSQTDAEVLDSRAWAKQVAEAYDGGHFDEVGPCCSSH